MAAGGKNTLLTYIIVILVILAINLFGGYFIAQRILNYTYRTDDLNTLTEKKSENIETNQVSILPGTPVPLDPINLNPANSNGEIFSCDLVLEAKDPLVVKELSDRNVQIVDKIANYLSLKTVQELSDAKMWDQYRNEMIDLINSVLTTGKISNLYIKQKIIQYP